MRIATPAWYQKMASQQLSKAAGRLPPDGGGKATSALPPFEPAPFLFGVQGDFLEFNGEAAGRYGLGSFDAAFDRGGLVAVTPADRPGYARNLSELLAPGGRLLLVAVEHDATTPAGPPHSLDGGSVRALLGRDFEVKELSREDRMAVEPMWKERGASRFEEVAYMCTRKPS